MNKLKIIQFFKSQIKHFQDKETYFRHRDQQLSFFRISWFFVILIGVVWAANFRAFDWVLTIAFLGLIIFVISIKYHRNIKFQHQYFKILVRINQMEINRLEGNFSHFQHQGIRFMDAKHPYSSDLDIFGKNALFQWLCRAETASGQEKLAAFLQRPASKEDILKRQKAVQELAQKTSFRQDFQAHGMYFQNHKKVQFFKNPAESENMILPYQKLYFLSILLPILLIISVFGVFWGLPYGLPFLILVINGMVLKQNHEKITEIIEQTSKNLAEIQAFSALSKVIEKATFESDLLCKIQKDLIVENNSVSLIINKLERIIASLEFRGNAFFYGFFNLPFLWEIHQMRRFEKLKNQYKNQWQIWFDAVAKMEVLNSFGGVAFACQDFHFPIISDKPYHFEAQNLAHPLIFPAETRICNDFSMQGNGICNLITGSNMSGKSTFLRTVGINIVLALAGAPVCAEKMQVAIVQLFTSMRTEDSLSERISSFYAELKRIRQLLDRIEKDEQILYFLDEILKGTNSDDRHRGGKAIIKQLQNQGVSGFISTHDLDLGKQTEHLPNAVRNFSFNSQIEADKLVFSYQISEGLCRSFNASILMQQIGIKVDM